MSKTISGKNKGIFIVLVLLVFAMSLIFFNENKKNDINKLIEESDEKVTIHYFHSKTCPFCKKQDEFIEKNLFNKYNLEIKIYNVDSKEGVEVYNEFLKRFDELPKKFIQTPTTIIGNEISIGYNSDSTTGKKLEEMIKKQIQLKLDK